MLATLNRGAGFIVVGIIIPAKAHYAGVQKVVKLKLQAFFRYLSINSFVYYLLFKVLVTRLLDVHSSQKVLDKSASKRVYLLSGYCSPS